MPLDFLSEHRHRIEEALTAYRAVQAAGERFFEAVAVLPPDIQIRVLTEVTQDGKVAIHHPQAPAITCSCRKPSADRVKFPKPKTTPKHPKLPNPKEVLLSILRQNSEGIRLEDIQRLARGTFTTRSRDPEHVVRTIVGQLLREKFIERDEEGLHKPTVFFPS
jgi:hypothetical protein